MVPSPPEVSHLLGASKPKYCAAHIWCWPTSVVTMGWRSRVISHSRCTAAWGAMRSVVCANARQSRPRHSAISAHHARWSVAVWPRARHTFSRSSSTCPTSPTMPRSTCTTLLMLERSISTWILRLCGLNASSLPVTRSSKRAPRHSIRSQRFIARLAS
jgi:hypothetical protein